MATLSVLKFNTAEGAEQMSNLLGDLQNQQLITVQDSAIVSWPKGAKKPKTKQLYNTTGIGALDGAFWGMLFGLLFFIPVIGLAVGAGMGALTGAFADVGIDDKFINNVRNKVTEGTSALFVMTSGAVQDKVLAAVKSKGLNPEIIETNLPKEQEDKLREAFAAA